MKKEYDFSQAKRGRFFRQDAVMNVPVYLDEDVKVWIDEQAESQGVDFQKLVNALLRQDIALIQEVMGR